MERTTEPTSRKKSWGRSLAFLLAGALVAVGIIVISEQRSDASDIACSMSECPTVKKKHNKAAKLYKAGKTGRSDGFKPKKMFEKPKAAKQVFGRRIGAVMKKQAEAAAARAGVAPEEVPIPGNCQDWRCAGIREYRRMTDHAGCVDLDPAIFPPDEQSCTVQEWDAPFTEKQVKNGGKVVVCGASFAIAVRLRAQRYGDAIMATTGLNCTFALWDLLD